jgi:hypothetical protein
MSRQSTASNEDDDVPTPTNHFGIRMERSEKHDSDTMELPIVDPETDLSNPPENEGTLTFIDVWLTILNELVFLV